jgi:hypothetical protein
LGFGAFFLNSGDNERKDEELKEYPPINFLGKIDKRKTRLRRANPRALGTNPRALGTNPRANRLGTKTNV